ncbi:hypothetical protein LMH87_006184 [Akanthomyces muscarius]|uniref:Uncharacterized protein n=1 Tax=Akanthomyces muscarius TaxID=2231603 RepID=A0A9W8UQ19_AKAMU|nr:hypothetical protein LMH87_006184 [Akanthomyces muscarius]KAJ4164512.1 hypothetical protein LMH87_006184 [Akanthomyces muscarius]
MQLATLQAFVASAVVILAPVADASVLHRNLHHQARRHTHLHHEHHRALESPPSSVSSVVKRGTCAFPTDDPNLVAVTPDQKNAGWAMSPDQSCEPGHYCPIACKEGMVMNQWQPDSTYTYPSSMNGGLFCDDNGNIKKPFPGEPNCVPGTGTVKAINKCGKKISYCQTVLPGNEAMLIPTVVDSMSTLAVPGISYWQKTAAHFYINGPGVGSEGCIWGTDSNPLGNWAHYVAGANTDASGQTFVQLSINPMWKSSALFSTKPGFGVKIECPDGGCNGLPCEISEEGEIKSNNLASGAGGASFCVVTVPKGGSAHIVAFDGSGGHSSAPALGNAAAAQDSSSSSSSTSSSTPPPPSTTSTHSSTPSPTPTSTSTSTTTSSSTRTTTTTSSHTTTTSTTTTTTTTTTVSTPSSTTSETPTVQPGIFHEENNSTATHTANSTYAGSPSSPQATPTTKDKKNESGRQQGSTAIVSLVFAVVAAACFY